MPVSRARHANIDDYCSFQVFSIGLRLSHCDSGVLISLCSQQWCCHSWHSSWFSAKTPILFKPFWWVLIHCLLPF